MTTNLTAEQIVKNVMAQLSEALAPTSVGPVMLPGGLEAKGEQVGAAIAEAIRKEYPGMKIVDHSRGNIFYLTFGTDA